MSSKILRNSPAMPAPSRSPSPAMRFRGELQPIPGAAATLAQLLWQARAGLHRRLALLRRSCGEPERSGGGARLRTVLRAFRHRRAAAGNRAFIGQRRNRARLKSDGRNRQYQGLSGIIREILRNLPASNHIKVLAIPYVQEQGISRPDKRTRDQVFRLQARGEWPARNVQIAGCLFPNPTSWPTMSIDPARSARALDRCYHGFRWSSSTFVSPKPDAHGRRGPPSKHSG